MGCPEGVHFSVDLGPFGLKLGVHGVPADWGIFSNAAYTAVNYGACVWLCLFAARIDRSSHRSLSFLGVCFALAWGTRGRNPTLPAHST